MRRRFGSSSASFGGISYHRLPFFFFFFRVCTPPTQGGFCFTAFIAGIGCSGLMVSCITSQFVVLDVRQRIFSTLMSDVSDEREGRRQENSLSPSLFGEFFGSAVAIPCLSVDRYMSLIIMFSILYPVLEAMTYWTAKGGQINTHCTAPCICTHSILVFWNA